MIFDLPNHRMSPIYLDAASREFRRLLSMMDRDPASNTLGAGDRLFWSWKFTDFPMARFQESAYAVAWLFTNRSSPAPYQGSPALLSWLTALLKYWRGLQHRDGSFDEAYPCERSLAAVSFTGFYIGEAIELAKASLPADETAATLASLGRAAEWLCHHDETHGLLSNHLAAAAAALTTIGQLTGEPRFLERARHFLQRIYDHQSSEGWYEEYGGFDPGYQTHGTFYLARIWQRTGDTRLLESLRRATEFLAQFIHPDGSFGGEYGSRNTEFQFPAGFEMLAGTIPEAGLIAEFFRKNIRQGCGVGLPSMDPQNFLPMLNNYLFAHTHFATGPVREATRKTGTRLHPKAGIVLKRTAKYFAILGTSKGGVLKAWDADGRAISLPGYFVRTSDRRVISSQHLDHGAQVETSGEEVRVVQRFALARQRTMKPWLFMGFRLTSLVLYFLPRLAPVIKSLLVKVLVSRKDYEPFQLDRRVRFGEEEIEVTDTLTNESGEDSPMPAVSPKFATIHMGSSRYFQVEDLIAAHPPAASPEAVWRAGTTLTFRYSLFSDRH